MAERINIRNGPCNMLLMQSLMRPYRSEDGTDPSSALSVRFTVDSPPGNLLVSIDSMQREDGSGNSWNLTGHLINNSQKFEGHYRTSNRKGFLVFT